MKRHGDLIKCHYLRGWKTPPIAGFTWLMEDREMGQRMKMYKKQYSIFIDTKNVCDKCALRKMQTCPYLEEVANCHLFKRLEGRPEEMLSLRHAS